MSKKTDRLAERVNELVECSTRLRNLLTHYEEANLELVKLMGEGHHALPALRGVQAPIKRREVTETFEEFDATRHEVRLALLAVCMEEGESRSEVGRVLGISRQLASRLAAEVERRDAPS